MIDHKTLESITTKYGLEFKNIRTRVIQYDGQPVTETLAKVQGTELTIVIHNGCVSFWVTGDVNKIYDLDKYKSIFSHRFKFTHNGEDRFLIYHSLG